MAKKRLSKEKQGLTVLTPDNDLRFECHEGLDCFTRCCRNVTIVLTPYDIRGLFGKLHDVNDRGRRASCSSFENER